MAKLGHGIVKQEIDEGVAMLTTLPTGQQNWGNGIVRQVIAAGVANLTTLPTGWQNWGTV